MGVSSTSCAGCESPPNGAVACEDIVFEIYGDLDAFLAIESHPEDLSEGVPLDQDRMVLAIFNVGIVGIGLNEIGW